MLLDFDVFQDDHSFMAVLLHRGHEEMDGRIFKQQPGLVDHRQRMACLTEAGS